MARELVDATRKLTPNLVRINVGGAGDEGRRGSHGERD